MLYIIRARKICRPSKHRQIVIVYAGDGPQQVWGADKHRVILAMLDRPLFKGKVAQPYNVRTPV